VSGKGNKFGKTSTRNLKELDPRLQSILNEAIKVMDFSITEGHRGKEKQDEFYKKRLTKLQYPKSKHNKFPSLAVDICPYPIDWKNKKRFALLAGIIKGIAHAQGISIRWGGDWDGDNFCSDEHFLDMPHFELV